MKEKESNKTVSKTTNNGTQKPKKSGIATLIFIGTGVAIAAIPFLLGFGTYFWVSAIALGLAGFSFGAYYVAKTIQEKRTINKSSASKETTTEKKTDSKNKSQEATKTDSKRKSEKLDENSTKEIEEQARQIKKTEQKRESKKLSGIVDSLRVDHISPRSFAVYGSDGTLKHDSSGKPMVYRIVNDSKFYDSVFDFVSGNTSDVCVFKFYDSDSTETSVTIDSENYKEMAPLALKEIVRIGKNLPRVATEENNMVM